MAAEQGCVQGQVSCRAALFALQKENRENSMTKLMRCQLFAATALAAGAFCAAPAWADATPPCNNGTGSLSTQCGTNSVPTREFGTPRGQLPPPPRGGGTPVGPRP